MSKSNNKTLTQNLYNSTASQWIRSEPSSLSDFTARPFILELCEPITGLRVLDLGCGEGYCSRELRRRGAAQVHGIDLSQAMINAARSQEAEETLGISYEVGCATDLKQFDDGTIDLVVAVFLFNYLTTTQTQQCMAEVARLLSPGGRFVFSVPHPSFPYIHKGEYPFYFQVEGAGYFSKRDQQFPGRIWKRDGSWLNVQLVHKTLEDYFDALKNAGFNTMPTLRELKVTPEHLAVDESFFSPLIDIPLHLAIQISK
ncbi:MAG: class I SAM-dependent methyltransferase [Desmonostoc vinosum HA7617-LM4]|jgi:ubiquinone/menaquinone biosynthesis C-methylase UbiE|nr:class I SAM-dependent methyltransferase [Desmonostoc vinosum HA7617-LM4]